MVRKMLCVAAFGLTMRAIFSAFNAVFKEYFGAHPPARACVQTAWWSIARWRSIAWPGSRQRALVFVYAFSTATYPNDAESGGGL